LYTSYFQGKNSPISEAIKSLFRQYLVVLQTWHVTEVGVGIKTGVGRIFRARPKTGTHTLWGNRLPALRPKAILGIPPW